jgi:uridine kinase
MKPIFVGISGGSSSGKTEFADEITESLTKRGKKVFNISLDRFYKDLDENSLKLAKEDNYNFDHPNSCDTYLMFDIFSKMKRGEIVYLPSYSFLNHKRENYFQEFNPKDYDVILIEGIFALCFNELLEMMNLKIYVDVESDTRLARRILRDMEKRGRTLHSIINQYNKFVKPSHDEIIEHTKKNADIIIPHGGKNYIAVNIISTYILTL